MSRCCAKQAACCHGAAMLHKRWHGRAKPLSYGERVGEFSIALATTLPSLHALLRAAAIAQETMNATKDIVGFIRKR